MAVVAGIDEAGYGPLLGPLVVSAAAFRVPEEDAEADLWERFNSVVTRKAEGKTGRVRVADSKAIHKGGHGVRALEENLLPFLNLLGPAPRNARELAENCRRPGTESLRAFPDSPDSPDSPWYGVGDLPLPRSASAAEIRERAEKLRAGLAAEEGVFLDARCETLGVPEFNAAVRRAGSKAVPAARCVAELMQHVCERAGGEDVTFFVDRQGGRKSYGPFLLAVFPERRLEVIEETAMRSEYAISQGGRRARVRFEARADSLYLPVSLASMLSKYVRELHMEMLNDFWRARVPDLRPTAGYYEDGRRFLADIETARAKAGIAREMLERCR